MGHRVRLEQDSVVSAAQELAKLKVDFISRQKSGDAAARPVIFRFYYGWDKIVGCDWNKIIE